MKQFTKFKRLLSGVLSIVMAVSAVPIVSAHAEESPEPYPYTLFAASSDEGSITVNAENFCVNGNVATNGTIVSNGNMNINGTRTENADESMIFIFDKIDNQYFSAPNVDEYDEDYTIDEMNININVPTEVQGEATLTGNININTALKALEDVNLYGEVKNTNDSVIFSQYGDIVIDSQNVNLNGLVYAPFGSVNITAQNLNMNNVVIIADSIVVTGPNINANYSNNVANFIGVNSENCPIITVDKTNMVYNYVQNAYYTTTDFQMLNGFLGKSDKIISFDVKVYDLVDTLIYSSSITPELKWRIDDIGLMCGVNKIVLTAKDTTENIYTYEITLVVDSSKFVSNMQIDLNDDDGDGLWNYLETYFGTDPHNVDTDGDGLTDYLEIYTLGYNPLAIDTDEDGILDGDEDEDEDGLSNLFEVSEFGSNPIFSDSDHDGLKDDEELKFGTSPVMKDTDEDGISDYDEYYLFNTDPLISNPSEMQYTKTYTVDDIEGSYDKGLYPTITLSGDSDCIKNFHMSALKRTPCINASMVGYIGSAYCFETTGNIDVIASALGGEDLLVKQDKKLLTNYLSTILDMPTDNEDGVIDVTLEVIDANYEFLDCLETLVGEKAYDKILADEVKVAIADLRKEISELQSEIDLARNARTIKSKTYNQRLGEIAKKQSDLDRGRFAQKYEAEFNEKKAKFNKRFDDFGKILDFVQFGYARYESINNLVEYSQKLARFGQFKELLEDLSRSDFEYVAEAASSVLNEVKKQEDGTYKYTAASQYLHDAVSDAVEWGVDYALGECFNDANAVLAITKLLTKTFLGKNLSLKRENLLNADFTTTLVLMTLDNVKNICGSAKKSKLDISYYICEDEVNCSSIRNSMIYAISARKFGEDMYLKLSDERSGVIGWLFDYNPLDHSTATRTKAYNNTIMLADMLEKYDRYIRV